MSFCSVLFEESADISLIKERKIAVIGYGNQAKGQSLNLQDSGVDVVIALREGSDSWALAEKDGFKVLPVSEAVRWANFICMLIPDESQKDCYNKCISPYLDKGDILFFSHGFNIHYKFIVPPKDVDVIMVAPKGPGTMVRKQYLLDSGVPCLFSVYQDKTGTASDLAISYASAIGGARAGLLETTFKEEVETDLFGEQTVLCGGISALILAGFEVLVEAGYSPQMAYFECLHETKLIVDLIFQGGLSLMREKISCTAEYGDLTRGKRVIDEKTRDRMREILKEIQSGKFAQEWMDENAINKGKNFNKLREEGKGNLLERVGKELRSKITIAS